MDLVQFLDVPAHDQRDFDFAKKYNLKIKTVVRPNDEKENFKVNKEAYTGSRSNY